MQTQHHIEAATIVASKQVAVYGGGTAAVSGAALKAGIAVSITDITTIVGAVCAVLGLIVTVYFQIRRDRREQREHESRLKNSG